MSSFGDSPNRIKPLRLRPRRRRRRRRRDKRSRTSSSTHSSSSSAESSASIDEYPSSSSSSSSESSASSLVDAPPPSSPIARLGHHSAHTLAIPAPICTIGPSGPTASALPTPPHTPTIFAAVVRPLNSPGTSFPFNVAITAVTPPPLANGARYVTTHPATSTNTDDVHANSAAVVVGASA